MSRRKPSEDFDARRLLRALAGPPKPRPPRPPADPTKCPACGSPRGSTGPDPLCAPCRAKVRKLPAGNAHGYGKPKKVWFGPKRR